MTSPGYPQPAQDTPWTRYLTREHAARDGYLAATRHAHAEYLTGPWPDRESYQLAERQAWVTYYQAGRAALNAYRAEMTARETTLPRRQPAAADRTAGGSGTGQQTGQGITTESMEQSRADLEARHGLNCTEGGVPWRQPSPACQRRLFNVHPLPPAAGPAAGAGTGWPGSPPAPAQPTYTPTTSGDQ